jgi:pSer/pThr/pTyr-binding forkhead associated (FHA) protein
MTSVRLMLNRDFQNAMKARLIEPGSTPEQTREILLSQSEFLIGRGADCDLRLRAARVSRHHCLLRTQAGGVTLADLGSSNGTFLNGQRVTSQAALRSGDLVQVGDFSFVVELGDEHPQPSTLTGTDSMARTVKLSKPPQAPPGVP